MAKEETAAQKIMKKAEQARNKGGCVFPGCHETPTMRVSLPEVDKTKKIDGKEVKGAEVPCCRYHYFILSSGLFAVDVMDDSSVNIKGLFHVVALIESVLAAKEMVTKGAEQKFGIRRMAETQPKDK